MPYRDPAVPLRHMLDHAREAVEMVRGKSRADLNTDRKLNLALVRLLEVIGAAPRPIDDIIRDFAGSASSTAALLTALELRGVVQELPGKIFARA